MTYPDGNYYEGGFATGQREGHGKMVYADGNVYEGQWKYDLRHGEGKMFDAQTNTERDVMFNQGALIDIEAGETLNQSPWKQMRKNVKTAPYRSSLYRNGPGMNKRKV